MVKNKFLIVDDDERFRLLVAKKLGKFAQCFTSPGGEDALLQFEHHLKKEAPFQAVFMDIEMPNMNGHELIEKMRTIEKDNCVAPLKAFKLVMLTVHKDVKNVSKSFFKGSADAYVHKDEISDKLIPELELIQLI